MDKKILKYKTKKTKLENEILEILNIKKENYEIDIANTNNNYVIIEFLKKFLNEMKFNNEPNIKKIIIIVSGNYSVGKSTFISYLENYILKISKNILYTQQINLIKKISFDTKIDIEIINKITIIEVNSNNLINLINLINSTNDMKSNNISILNIKIVPKNKKSLINKFINKIIGDIKNDTCEFVNKLNLNDNTISTITHDNINQLIKLKKSIYSDDDFIFLNQIVDVVFDSKSDDLVDLESKLSNITIFYL